MVTRRIQVILDATSSGLVRGLQEASRAADQAGDRIQKFGRHIEENERHYTAAGQALTAFGAATTAALGASAAAAVSWESSFAGVKKTVDDSAEGYAQLSGELRGMAKELPASHSAIAGVAEAAGQLGIQRENITSFTRTMIDLGETTNLSADEAATALARFSNIMGTSQSEVSNLGSAIVDLGNNYATTEAEIVAMGLRLAGAGRQAKLSEGEVLGLATALSSVGIEAEAGGTAFSRVIIEMGTAVESQGGKLDAFAKTAGMSAEEFSAAWRDNAGSAIAAFIGGLGELEASGQSVQPVLDELGMTDIRVGDALRRASAASDLFTDAMGRGNTAYAENTALAAEAEQRYATTASQLSVLKNNVIDAAISLGEVFLPAINALAEGGAGVASWLGDLPGPLRAIVGYAGAAAGGISLLAGALLLAAPRALETYRALQALNVIGPKTSGALRGMAGVLTGPWGLALAGAGIAVGAFIAHQEKKRRSIDEVRTTLDDQTGAITDNTRAWAANLAESEGALQWAADLGLAAGVVTDAMLGNADAQREVAEAAEAAGLAAVRSSDAWGAVDAEQAKAADSGRRLVDFIGQQAGVVDAASEAQARLSAEMESSGRSTQALATESARLTAQAEAYLAAQEAATGGVEKWIPAVERAAAAGEEAAEAYAEWHEGMRGLSGSFIDTSAALQASNDAARAWAEGQAEATADASDSWEDYVADASFALDTFLDELERQAAAQAEYHENMVRLQGVLSASAMQMLEEMGPAGAQAAAALVDGSDRELARFEEVAAARFGPIPGYFADAMADGGPVIAAAAQMWGQDIADEILEKILAGEMTVAEAVAAYDLETTIDMLANPAKFDETLNAAIALGNGETTTPDIDGDPALFEKALNASLALGNGETATPDIDGDNRLFLTALNSALATGNRESSTSKILGSSVPFMGTLNAALWAADRASATADLHLNTRSAWSALQGFLGSIPRSVSVALNAIPLMPRIPGFAEGGYTGQGGKYEPRGVVHADEFVHTKEELAQPGRRDFHTDLWRGMSVDEAYYRHKLRGYADGGPVGGPRFTNPAPVYSLPVQGRTSDASTAHSGPVDLSSASLQAMERGMERAVDRAMTGAEHTRRRLARADGRA